MTSTTSELAAFDFNKIRWAYFGLLIGMFASSISQTIVSPAIPRIVADLGGMAYYAWLSTIVMLVAAVVTAISGKLSDIFDAAASTSSGWSSSWWARRCRAWR